MVFLHFCAILLTAWIRTGLRPTKGKRRSGVGASNSDRILGLATAEASFFSDSMITILSFFIPIACNALTVRIVWLIVPRLLRETTGTSQQSRAILPAT